MLNVCETGHAVPTCAVGPRIRLRSLYNPRDVSRSRGTSLKDIVREKNCL